MCLICVTSLWSSHSLLVSYVYSLTWCISHEEKSGKANMLDCTPSEKFLLHGLKMWNNVCTCSIPRNFRRKLFWIPICCKQAHQSIPTVAALCLVASELWTWFIFVLLRVSACLVYYHRLIFIGTNTSMTFFLCSRACVPVRTRQHQILSFTTCCHVTCDVSVR